MNINHDRTRGLTPSLITSLTIAWKKQLVRKNERRRSKGQIEVVVGLTCVHFYCAQEQSFKDFLQQSHPLNQHEMLVEDTPEPSSTSTPKKAKFDPSNVDFGPGIPMTSGTQPRATQTSNPHQKHYPIHNVGIADYSNNGYYLRWIQNTPSQLAPGEIIGMRKPDQNLWLIGVVIWIRHTKGVTHSGVKILENKALPAAVIPKASQKQDYLRALMLSKSLITNAVGFHEYDQVNLYRPQGDTIIQLTKRLFGTGVISQFAFRELGQGQNDEYDEENSD